MRMVREVTDHVLNLPRYRPTIIDAEDDHRITMSAVVLAVQARRFCLIMRWDNFKTSYPTFFEDLKRLCHGHTQFIEQDILYGPGIKVKTMLVIPQTAQERIGHAVQRFMRIEEYYGTRRLLA